MRVEKVQEIREALNKFSFEKVVIKENPKLVWDTDWAKNKGYCTYCEEKEYNKSQRSGNDTDYRLHFVSHGTHSLDFCKSMSITLDDTWNDIPVLFLFENPSIQYGELFEKEAIKYGKSNKYPAKKWYWVHGGYDKEDCIYPKSYKQGCYGELIACLIKSFKLANAYMTNIVKCGMNTDDGKKYLGTEYYHEECIKNCINNVLKKEIEILNAKKEKLIIFAFSKRVYNLAVQYLDIGNYEICLMPHPASRLANDYRKYVLFGKVYKTLKNNHCNCEEALKEFLENDKTTVVKNISFTDTDGDILKKQFGEGYQFGEKFTKNKNAVIKLNTSHKIECKFRIDGAKLGFGFDSLSEDGYWLWDYDTSKYLEISALPAEFLNLYNIFCEYIESK